MPNVNSGNQVRRSGQHTRSDINKVQRPAKARDDLKASFAGEENKGPAKDKKEHSLHSTNVKSRTRGANRNNKQAEPIEEEVEDTKK